MHRDTSEGRNESHLDETINYLITFEKILNSNIPINERLNQSISLILDELSYTSCILFLHDEMQQVLRSHFISKNIFVESWFNFNKKNTVVELDITKEGDNKIIESFRKKKDFIQIDARSFLESNLYSVKKTLQDSINDETYAITIPIVSNEIAVGVLVFVSKSFDSKQQKPLLYLLANQIGISVQNNFYDEKIKKQLTTLQARTAKQKALAEVSQKIVSILNIQELCDTAMDTIAPSLGYLGAVITLLNDEGQLVTRAFSRNKFSSISVKLVDTSYIFRPDNVHAPEMQNTLKIRSFLDDKTITSTDFVEAFYPTMPKALCIASQKAINAKNVTFIPIHYEGKPIGVVFFMRKHTYEDEVNDDDIDFLETFVKIFEIAYKNARLFEEKSLAMADLKLISEELKSSQSKLEEKYKFERDIMGVMSHELRTPLTVAKGLTELLSTNRIVKENEYIHNKIQKIYSSILKGSDLIQKMLSTTHIDNQKVSLEIGKVNINDCIEYCSLAFTQLAKDKGLSFTCKTDPHLPIITSDLNRVQEILTNLVSNAVKYTVKGSVAVYTSASRNTISVTIEDTGLGIPKEDIQKLGTKFFRVNHIDRINNKVIQTNGTGLGLYVVKGIVDALGATLHIDSQVGKGSKFTVTLPIELESAQIEEAVDTADLFKQLETEK